MIARLRDAEKRQAAYSLTCRHPKTANHRSSCWRLRHSLFHPDTVLSLHEHAKLHSDLDNPALLLPTANKMLPTVWTVNRKRKENNALKHNKPYYPNPEALYGCSNRLSLYTSL